MGPHSPDSGRPAMPDPSRTVGRSIAMLTKLGFGRQASSWMVAAVARRAWSDLHRVGIDGLWWLEAIADEAERRSVDPNPSQLIETDNPHGDGPGSTTGSTA